MPPEQFSLKDFVGKAWKRNIVPSLLSFLNMILEAIVDGTIPEEELRGNAELVAFIYAGLQYADKALGEDEKAIAEITVDELKETLRNVTKKYDIPSITMNWDDV